MCGHENRKGHVGLGFATGVAIDALRAAMGPVQRNGLHGHQETPLSMARRTSSAEVRTPSFWRMIEEVLATVL